MGTAQESDQGTAEHEPRGWILYDASCGLCSRWAPFWSDYVRRQGYELAPLQDKALQRRFRLDEADLLKTMTLVLRDGSQLGGADVYRYFLRLSWLGYPLYLLSIFPGFKQIFDWSYRVFARNRHRITHACALQPRRTQDEAGRAALTELYLGPINR